MLRSYNTSTLSLKVHTQHSMSCGYLVSYFLPELNLLKNFSNRVAGYRIDIGGSPAEGNPWRQGCRPLCGQGEDDDSCFTELLQAEEGVLSRA